MKMWKEPWILHNENNVVFLDIKKNYVITGNNSSAWLKSGRKSALWRATDKQKRGLGKYSLEEPNFTAHETTKYRKNRVTFNRTPVSCWLTPPCSWFERYLSRSWPEYEATVSHTFKGRKLRRSLVRWRNVTYHDFFWNNEMNAAANVHTHGDVSQFESIHGLRWFVFMPH